MAVLTRNITGPDVLAIQKYVGDNEPTTDDSILEAFFPGDETDPYKANQVKPIKDAIAFLEEVDQIVSTSNGYRLHDEVTDFPSYRLSLLNGIRTQVGEDGAYKEVLDYLADEGELLFDREGPLVGAMNEMNPRRNWNETKLRYWSRVLEWVGVVKSINHTRGGTYNSMLSLQRDLTLAILDDVCSPGVNEIRAVLSAIDERYLPVHTSTGEIAPYVEHALLSLANEGAIKLTRLSDIGQSVAIGDDQPNAIDYFEGDS